MKTAKYTDEERKERRAMRNKNYYTKNKEFWTEYNGQTYSVYVLSGFSNDMVWVGITRTLKRHLAEHKKTFGEQIKADVLLTIDNELTEQTKSDILALLARRFASRCLNPVSLTDVDFKQVEERQKKLLQGINGSAPEQKTEPLPSALPA